MRWQWAMGLLLLGMFSGLCVATSRNREPVYAGKTVNQWLDAGFEDASMALQEIGPPAVPYILAKLAREDPACGSLCRYRRVWSSAPPFVRRAFPKPGAGDFYELRACSALLETGPQSLPLLAVGLEDSHPIVREVSAHALGCFRQRNKDMRGAVPGLLRALHDPNAKVRTRAAWALGDATVYPMRHL